jgi:serine protease DegS
VARASRFLLTYSLIGVLIAAALLILFPGLGGRQVVDAPASAISADPLVGPVSYSSAVTRAAPAVVSLFLAAPETGSDGMLSDDQTLRHYFDPPPRPQSRASLHLGSGVIVSADGHILTNNHVIRDVRRIQVALQDGRSVEARLVGADPETDLAVLAVDLDALPVVTFGQSDRLQVGDVVLAIGNPYAVGQTVTKGIVSATNRRDLGLSTFENFIQTDAAINPGNSGGALINAHGQLVGINTAIFSQSGGFQGIGFAIPEHIARSVLEQLIRHGRVIRGWAGLEVQNLNPPLAEALGLNLLAGAVVSGVLRGGPAAIAGLEPGDVITGVNGQSVGNTQDLLRLISGITPGDTAELHGVRARSAHHWTLHISERPQVFQPAS